MSCAPAIGPPWALHSECIMQCVCVCVCGLFRCLDFCCLIYSYPSVFTKTKTKVAKLPPPILVGSQEAVISSENNTPHPLLFLTCILLLLLNLTLHSHLDPHYAFSPKFTRHTDTRTCTDSLSFSLSPSLPASTSPLSLKYQKCLPHYAAPSSFLPPLSPPLFGSPAPSPRLSWRSKWRQRSLLPVLLLSC